MLNLQPTLFPLEQEAPFDFRVIHYLGSKLRLLAQIRQTVSQVVPPGGRVLDLFAGSGAVSLGLRQSWCVVAADIQEYSRVLCSALLNPPPDTTNRRRIIAEAQESELRRRLQCALAPVLAYESIALEDSATGSMSRLCALLEHGSLFMASAGVEPDEPRLLEAQQETLRRLSAEGLDSGVSSVITRYFGGVYFSWRQAIDLDVVLTLAHAAPEAARDQLVAAALSVASDVVNTVGKQFAQPIRPRDSKGRLKLHLVRQTIRDRSSDVLSLYDKWLERYSSIRRTNHRHQAIRGDFEDVLREHVHNVDLVYADPPYTRDHYSRYYHVLETMALRDEPAVSTTKIRTKGQPAPSRGLYRKERHQSPFSIKSKAPGAFDLLCRTVADAGKSLLLSYSRYDDGAGNRPRLLTIEELGEIAEKRFTHISVIDVAGVTHNKLNVDERNVPVDYTAEFMMLCQP